MLRCHDNGNVGLRVCCMLIKNAVVYMKSALFTNSYVQKYLPLEFIVRIVYMCITYFNT